MLMFLASPLGKYALIGLAVMAIVGGLYAAGRHSEVKAEAVRSAKVQAQVAQTNGETAALAVSAGQAAATSQAGIIQHTKTLQEHAHAAVPPSADVRLNGGFVGLYNASLGLVPYDPAASPGTDSAAGAVRASDALETIAGNDGVCLAWRDRAERLTAFYGAVRVKVNGK
jgi:hypothetical protein